MSITQEGGCLCRGVRYTVTAEPEKTNYCHCRMCQLSAGAPVMVWWTVSAGNFRWLQGSPRAYRSSAKAERLFCPDCGTQLLFREPGEPGKVDLNLATLDDTGVVPPTHHIWTSSRIAWFDTTDDLPRYREGSGSGPG
jgi:hypothetical protein